MLFNSYGFIFGFLPIVVLGFFVAGKVGHRTAMAWMCLASILFYGWWAPRFVPLLLLSVAINFVVARRIVRASAEGLRLRWMWTGIVIDLGALGYFKYANFFLESFSPGSGHLDIVLPLGISFFTFTQIAFLVDVARRQVAAVEPVTYLLFVTFFPHLIAGPLYHHAEIIPQFRSRNWLALDAENIEAGAYYFIVGLFKKAVVADGLASIADQLFNDAARGAAPDGWTAIVGISAFTFQLYFDFSGYSDMAIGLARMLNVRLPFNFDAPYKATSIADFWRRWHMTLSAFLRDYLYFPLGGNRRGEPRRYVNLLVTMFLGGLWHGAAWTFVAWGTLHGVFLAVNHLWRRLVGHRPATNRLAQGASWALTFACVSLAWVLFRSDSMATALRVYRALSTGWNVAALDPLAIVLLVFAAILALAGPPSQQWIGPNRAASMRLATRSAFASLLVGMMLFVSLKALWRSEPSPFLYFNF